MQNTVMHKAKDLSPDQRRMLETLLGRTVQEDENISVRAFKGEIIKQAPTGDAREAAFWLLRTRINQTAQRGQGVPEEEIDGAIDEAADYVRHNRE